MTDQRPLLLVIGAGEQEFREYLLASIGARYRVHLFGAGEPCWECRHISDWTVLPDPTETVAAGRLSEVARRVAATVGPVAGVLTWDEARVLQVAKVAAALDLPGGDPAAVMRCRDKHLTRQALAAAGVPQPGYALADSVEQALAAAARLGYPVVLKPRAMAASLGVVRVDNPRQLREQFDFARAATVPGAWRYDTVLVEEFATGPEVSIDSAVAAGAVSPMFLARKELGYPPYFEEVGHLVDADDPLWNDSALARVVRDAHRALGLTDAMTHTELRLSPDGPKVIEVNARLGGDLIPYLGRRATGIDPGLVAAAVATGRPPPLTVGHRRAAGVRFFYPPYDDATIDHIGVDGPLPPGTEVSALVGPGEVVSPPPRGTAWGRLAYAVSVADTAQQCRQALTRAESALTVRVGAAPVTGSGPAAGSDSVSGPGSAAGR